MKTVLFVDDQVRSTLPNFDLFVGDMETKYDFEVCRWVPGSVIPEETVPGLEDMLEVGEDWRAVILCDISECAPGEFIENPFDFQANGTPGAPVHELAQMLGDMPASFFEGEELEDGSYRFVRKGHEELRECHIPSRKYHVPFGRPRELLLVTPRNIPQDYDENYAVPYVAQDIEEPAVDEQNPKKRLSDKARPSATPRIDSLFWECNTYPSNARFLVFDRPEPPSKAYDKSLFDLMFAVLQLCLADFETGELEAYKLHKLVVRIDEERYKNMLFQRMHAFESILELVPEELERLERASRSRGTGVSDIDVLDRRVYCQYQIDDDDDLYIERGHFGPTKDQPRRYAPDHAEWRVQRKRVEASFRKFIKIPRRAVARAVDLFTTLRPDEQTRRVRLDADQTEDVQMLLQEEEVRLAGEHLDIPLDAQAFRKAVDKEEHGVRTIISRRPYSSQLLVCLAVILVAFFFGFGPYTFGWLDGSQGTVAALPVTLISLALVIAVGVVVLFYHYRSFLKWLNRFNAAMQDAVSAIRNAAIAYSDRMSAFATYRSRSVAYHAQFDKAQANDITDEIEKIVRISADVDEMIERGRALEAHYDTGEIVARRGRAPFNNWTEVCAAVDAGVLRSLFGDNFDSACTLNEVRDVPAAFAFISELLVQRLAVFEPLRDEDGQRRAALSEFDPETDDV